MNRTLLLMRHGKSSWDTPDLEDFNRTLSKRGRRDAPRMGDWLANSGMIPDLILSSPAVRARQTTEAVLERLDLRLSLVQFEPRIYEASLKTLLDLLAGCPNSRQCVLLVGHNPGLDDLCRYLCTGPFQLSPHGKLMTTAAVAEIRLPEVWRGLAEGSGELIQLMRPKALPDTPFG